MLVRKEPLITHVMLEEWAELNAVEGDLFSPFEAFVSVLHLIG